MTDSAAVALADGYGINIAINRGHLLIHDGIGSQRRTRRFSRVERDLRRIVILGHTGSITLEATRWCAERGAVIVQLDVEDRIVFLSAVPGLDDARVRRAQALANGNESGLQIARELLAAKVRAQAANADNHLQNPILANSIRGRAAEIADAGSIADCLDAESHAANAYFGGWVGTVRTRFTERDHDLVPAHWHEFSSRRSPIMKGRTPRVAATPINAILNYLYALAEIEARIALITLGLDPGLGIVHVDAKARDSLALDLLEVARPAVDAYALELLARRHFTKADFHETREGGCRLMPHLAHELAVTTSLWATEIAPYAERIAHLLSVGTGRGAISTPLTQANRKAKQTRSPGTLRRPRGEIAPPPPLASTCRTCGAALPEKGRKLCEACWPVTRARLATERAARGVAARAVQRLDGRDPTQTPEARAARSHSLSVRKLEEISWEPSANTLALTADDLNRIITDLSGVTLARMQSATGLSISSCSKIRSGVLRPHRRHWMVLAELGRVVSAEAVD